MVDATDIADWCFFECGLSEDVSLPNPESNRIMFEVSPVAHISSLFFVFVFVLFCLFFFRFFFNPLTLTFFFSFSLSLSFSFSFHFTFSFGQTFFFNYLFLSLFHFFFFSSLSFFSSNLSFTVKLFLTCIFFFLEVKTPTLILLGDDDKRVPPFQGKSYFNSLQRNGVKSK